MVNLRRGKRTSGRSFVSRSMIDDRGKTLRSPPLLYQSSVDASIALPLLSPQYYLEFLQRKNTNSTEVQVPTFKTSKPIDSLQVCVHNVHLRPVQVAPRFSNIVVQRLSTYNGTKYEHKIHRPCPDCWFRQNYACCGRCGCRAVGCRWLCVWAQQARGGTKYAKPVNNCLRKIK